jgi:hypothetical protein
MNHYPDFERNVKNWFFYGPYATHMGHRRTNFLTREPCVVQGSTHHTAGQSFGINLC